MQFSVGDYVRRKARFTNKESIYRCCTGVPVQIVKIDSDGDLIFSEYDGGSDWWSQFYFEPADQPFDIDKAIQLLKSNGYIVVKGVLK
jgi:ABC-type transport system substrate-binding protein